MGTCEQICASLCGDSSGWASLLLLMSCSFCNLLSGSRVFDISVSLSGLESWKWIMHRGEASPRLLSPPLVFSLFLELLMVYFLHTKSVSKVISSWQDAVMSSHTCLSNPVTKETLISNTYTWLSFWQQIETLYTSILKYLKCIFESTTTFGPCFVSSIMSRYAIKHISDVLMLW